MAQGIGVATIKVRATLAWGDRVEQSARCSTARAAQYPASGFKIA